MDPGRPDEVNRLVDCKNPRTSAKRLREQPIFGSLQPAQAVQHASAPSAPLTLCYCRTPPGVGQGIQGGEQPAACSDGGSGPFSCIALDHRWSQVKVQEERGHFIIHF